MLNFIEPVISIVDKVVDRAVPDKKQAKQLKHEIQMTLLKGSSKELEAARDIIVAEAQAGGPSSTWRPHLMYLFMFVIAFNSIVVPLVNVAFGVEVPVLDALSAVPDKVWDIIMLCVGGYIGGRSLEKFAKNWKDK